MGFTAGIPNSGSLLLILTMSAQLIALQIDPAGKTHCKSSFCIRKCCPEDQIWDFAEAMCKKSPFQIRTILADFLNQTFSKDPFIIIGNGCPDGNKMKAKAEYPDEILPHGDILHSGRRLTIEDYCMDYSGLDGHLRINLFTCSIRRSMDQVKFPDEDFAEVEKIPVSKCCPEGNPHYFLSPLSKVCTQLNLTRNQWPPPVTSATGSKVFNLPESDFNITHSPTKCPAGFITKSSAEFTLYNDGTISIPGLDKRLSAGSFCVDALDDLHYNNPDNRSYAVVYCVPDICRNGIACVKKCCPFGYIYSAYSKQRCVKDSRNLTFEFRNRNNASHPLESTPHLIRDGSTPTCDGLGLNLLNPFEIPQEMFHLLPDSGNLYIPGYSRSREQEEYCIDNIEIGEILPLAFICFPPEPQDPPGYQTALAIYPYFMSISIIFLILIFSVYAALPELQNLHGITIMCQVLSLTVTFVGLCIVQTGVGNNNSPFCKCTAIIVHFFFLASFTWLNVMGFDLWNTFRTMRPMNTSSKKKIRHLIYYSCFAWGLPLVIVITGQILENIPNLPESIIRPEFGIYKCWFYDKYSLLVYFYGPIALNILTNIIFFMLTAIKLYNVSREASFATQQKGNKERFRLILYVFVLMGVFWILEIISFAAQGSSAHIWILFDLLNILTGFFMFIIFVCKRQVILLLRKRYSFFNRGWKIVCKDRPNWDRITDPGLKLSEINNTTYMPKAINADAKRKISTTNTTQNSTHDTEL